MAYLTNRDLLLLLDQLERHFRRLEGIYWAMKEAGLTEDNDDHAKLVRRHLEQLEMAGFVTSGMAQTPGIRVAPEALAAFHELAAEAGSILDAKWARAFAGCDGGPLHG
jgi:hypothetical protein